MDYKVVYSNWLEDPRLSREAYEELKGLTDEKDIEYRFGGELEFGTAGMRGLLGFGTNMMNIYTVRRATEGLAKYICSMGFNAMEKGVAISYDTRKNSELFAKETAGVLINNGIHVYLFEKASPVPMLSFAVRKFKTIAGVMITASHNPKEYNGYKVYGDDGAQMSPEATAKVVEYIKEIKDYLKVESKEYKEIVSDKRLALIGKSFDKLYINTLRKLSLSKDAVKKYGKDLKIVYTPLHGTGFRPVTMLLAKMKINVTVVPEQVEPDSSFPTVEVPNPENKEALTMGINLANKINADVVFGTDPDSDRLGVALRNKEGEFVALSGNQVGVLLTNYVLTRLKQEKKIPKNGVVIKSFVSTDMVRPICENYGVKLIEVPVGFKFIGEKIKQFESDNSGTFLFGFEESCGYLRGTHARDKDAVVASMLVAEMVCYYKSINVSIYDILQKLYEKYGYVLEKTTSIKYSGLYAMKEMNAVVEKVRNATIDKVGIYNISATRDYLIGQRKEKDGKITEIDIKNVNCIYFELERGGFICLRPSGTEPKLKIYYSIVGKSKDLAVETLHEIDKEFLEILEKYKG